MAVYKDGKKTSDLNVQSDFAVKDTKDDRYIRNSGALQISIDGVVQEKTYNPQTGDATININIDDLVKDRDSAISDSIDALDTSDTLTDGNYYTGMTEKDGIVSMTQSGMDTTPTKDSKKPVTSGGVKAAIEASSTEVITVSSNNSYTPSKDIRYYVNTDNITLTINKISNPGKMITVIADKKLTVKYPDNSGNIVSEVMEPGTVKMLFSSSSGYISGIYGAVWN